YLSRHPSLLLPKPPAGPGGCESSRWLCHCLEAVTATVGDGLTVQPPRRAQPVELDSVTSRSHGRIAQSDEAAQSDEPVTRAEMAASAAAKRPTGASAIHSHLTLSLRPHAASWSSS